MRSERGGDGMWHAADLDSAVTLCGQRRIPLTRGRRSKVSCEVCIAAGGADALASPSKRTLRERPPWVPSPSPLARPLVDEPVIPEHGGCAQCGNDRKPERSRLYGGVEAERDPFCSMPCARRFYKLPLPSELMEERQALAAARAVA